MKMSEGFTFDDVLLKPRRSSVFSRKDVDVRTKISRNISLNIPIVSANMNTVTEFRMATAMARSGGLGIIHRFLSIDAQVEEVLKVKRAENFTIDEPFTVRPTTTLREVHELIRKLDVQSFLVVDGEEKLLGILTKRDLVFEEDAATRAEDLMTPRAKLVVGTPATSLEEAKEIFKKHKVEKLPLVDEDDRLVGLITTRDIVNRLNPFAVRDKKGRLVVGAAIGVRGDFLERADALVKAGTDLLVIDIAHGHLELCLKATKKIKERYPHVDVMSGNIATEEGARDLVEAGADAIKVGVGGGSICITRIQTGAGVPQLSALVDAKRGAGNVPVVADGGMRNSGDLTKALAAGASAGMFGSLFAGTDESPGEIVIWNGRRSKLYRGMASLGAYLDRKKAEGVGSDGELLADFVSEGADQVTVPYRGSATEVISQLVGGLRSGMSYCGASTIQELRRDAEFVKITDSGRKEGGVHDVEVG
ncbi:MAG: IMP dehydrogenase [Parcubacteria group bacterium]|nr:IMP dehydrogenase [Parcubacteria group bacterium]